MSESGSWQEWDGDRRGADLLAITPFTRLARVHGLSVAGDALFAIGLAGTIFFLSPGDAARTQVALYLVLTIAPFAVVAPLIGPALDRMPGGRRWTIFFSAFGRALVCFFLIRHLDGLLFYPEAFLMLVFSKAYHISKSAVVPTTVRGDAELVEANSKLSLISGLSVVVAAIPGGLLTWLGGPEWVLGLGMLVFIAMSASALKVPKTVVAAEPADAAERAELHSRAILLAASGMGLLRGIVGFLAFWLAFAYKSEDPWRLAVVAVTAQIGYLVGSFVAPRLRRITVEEYILIGSLSTTAVVALGAALTGGIASAALLSLVVGASSSAGKQSFDAIVQRDAPDANRGRSFAKFETRFQVVWVAGALIAVWVPAVISFPLQVGFLVIAGAGIFASVSYLLGLRGISFDASSRIRSWRRRRREDVGEETARRLGFAGQDDFAPPADPPTAPEPGISDARQAPSPPGETSAAAKAAERRRAARLEREEADKQRLARELADAEKQLDTDGPAPDLGWHPQ